MYTAKLLLTATLLSLVLVFIGQEKPTIPAFQISIDSWTRTSSYDYRVTKEGKRSYLEMRQHGKERWARVEDVTCAHDHHGPIESQSFDFSAICP